jgi:hypothetical protein
MKKLITLLVAGMFSVSAAAWACDGKDHEAKADKTAKVVKKDGKDTQPQKDSAKKS